jgi:hypothetical protein
MSRGLVVLLAIVGLTLAAVGFFVILAVGIPALGLNPYGRNPMSLTVSGLTAGVTLYLVGAAVLASATRWMRDHPHGSPAPALAFLAVMLVGWTGLMAVRGYWFSIAELALYIAAIFFPIALGVFPKPKPGT